MKESLQIWKRSCFLLTTGRSNPEMLVQGTGTFTNARRAFALDASENDARAVSIVGPCNCKL